LPWGKNSVFIQKKRKGGRKTATLAGPCARITFNARRGITEQREKRRSAMTNKENLCRGRQGATI